jgi:HEAT repeat protein
MAVAAALVVALVTSGRTDVDAADGEPEGSGLGETVDAILQRCDGAGQTALDEAGRELARLGRPAVPVLFDRLERACEAPADCPLPDRALIGFLGSFERRIVLAEVSTRIASDRVDPSTRVAALGVLGHVGRRSDLALLDRASHADGAPVDDAARAALEESLVEILERDPGSAFAVGACAGDLDADVAWTFARAVAVAGSPRGMKALADLLVHRGDLALTVLDGIGRLGEEFPYTVTSDVRDAVRRRLDENLDRQELRQTAQTLGQLEDHRSVGRLIELLGHDDALIRKTASVALRRITGVDFGEDRRHWEDWLAREQAWYDTEAPHLVGELDSNHLGRISAALSELAGRRYNRDWIAYEIGALASHPSPAVRELVCIALGQLGAGNALPDLLRLLANEEEAVRTAAHAALVRLTGSDLPDDVEAWRSAFPAVD